MKTILLSTCILAGIVLQAQPVKRYEFKSIVINYTIESSGMGSTTTGTKTLKVDDFGSKEAMEEISTTTTKLFGKITTEKKHTLDILKGDYGYSIDMITKEGTKMNVREVAKAFQPAGMAMADDLQKYKGKEGMRLFVEENDGVWEGEASLLGKNCWVFSMMGVKMWMYKGVVLKSESTAWGMNITETATSVDENMAIPASAFEIPAGISITEQPEMEGLDALMGGMDVEDDSPSVAAPGLPYDRFKAATTGLSITGYQYFLSDNSDNIYLTTYVKSETDQVVIMMENENRFDEMAEGGDGIELIKRYTYRGHDAAFLRITNEDDGTPTDARLFLYHLSEYQSVLYILTGIPMSQENLELIISKIRF